MKKHLKVEYNDIVVAIRSDAAEDAWNAWGAFSAIHGGHWCGDADIADWDVVDVPEPASS